MKITDVVIVADCSGSMGHLQQKQQDAVWQLIQTFAKAEAEQQLYLVSVHPFGTYVGQGCTPFTPASKYTRESLTNLNCNQGSTRLLDGIGHAFNEVQKRRGQLADAALVQVFTDGQENASTTWRQGNLGVSLTAAQGQDWFTLAMSGPRGAGELMKNIGLPTGNFTEWDGQTVESYRSTVQATQSAAETFTVSRSKGVRSVSNYYEVDPNKLNTAGIRSYMAAVVPTEVQTVQKRMAGRAIADAFTKFEKGRHYYQLIKPEYIEDGKELVVHIKDKNEYRLGSRSARQLLGIPETGKIRVKPVPSTSNFTIFVQSASNNRKLVEGQQLLTVP